MRRKAVADWSAGALAVIILTLGGLVVVKPAVDNWDAVYRADPFQVSTTTQRVVQRTGKAAETTTTKRKASAAERVLGNSGLLLLRLCLVALAAFLAAAALQRAILGSYALRVRSARAGASTAAFEPPLAGTPPIAEDSEEGTASTRNGQTAAQEPRDANLAAPIAKLVASRREELGLSQRELAKRAGISHTVISRIEQGEQVPSRRTLDRLADALQASS